MAAMTAAQLAGPWQRSTHGSKEEGKSTSVSGSLVRQGWGLAETPNQTPGITRYWRGLQHFTSDGGLTAWSYS
jgi:hypothetical protein